MSTETPVRDEQAQEPVLVVRTFRAEVAADFAKREIEGIVIPFDIPARVSDPPNFEPYEESVTRGAFRSVTNAPNRVLLDFEHYGATDDLLGSMGSIAGTLGHARHLEEQQTGLFGNFRVLRGSDGDKALELASEGVLGGFSVAMKPLRSVRTQTGLLQRIKVHLDRVSLCRVGAYEQARVMAVRTEQIIDAEDYEQPPDPELLARMMALGIALPDRYKPALDDNNPEGNEGTSEPNS